MKYFKMVLVLFLRNDKTEVTRVKLELRMNSEWWFEFWRVTKNKTERSDIN